MKAEPTIERDRHARAATWAGDEGPVDGRPARDRASPRVDLTIECARGSRSSQPVTFGVPIPKGALAGPVPMALLGPDGESVAAQAAALARWSDGSVKWLLLDAVLGPMEPGRRAWRLGSAGEGDGSGPAMTVQVIEAADRFEIETGTARFVIDRRGRPGLGVVEVDSRAVLEGSAEFVLADVRGRRATPRIEAAELEAGGPVRATVRLRGRFKGRVPCRFDARLSFFAGTGLVQIRWALHNPRRARHPGGLWDLGDPGSMLFRDLALELTMAGQGGTQVAWAAEPGSPERASHIAELEIYQDSSGGEHWRSTNHVNRYDRVPISFRGYRIRHGGQEGRGLRANPVVAVAGQGGTLAVAMPEFWQQFPKAIEVRGSAVRLRPFPGQFGDPFELQGGEQKTHTLWLHFGPPGEPSTGPLDWVHAPARVQAMPGWYAASGAIPRLLPAAEDRDGRLGRLLDAAVDGRTGLVARRELIDEYGWRHYGEIFADHEQEFFDGHGLAVSHYNNQYDMILGAIVQSLRTGEPRWAELFDPLARHVVDIDIYHTREDRAAYNGGLFWFTDHYMDARTCTHRTYSRHNCRPGDRSYGGGPSSNHLFTTGLLMDHYLTGDPSARDAVIELADWVVGMDDGRRTVLGPLDDGPTGLASVTGTPDYHGPGRGAGNSINALLDGWLATGRRAYLDLAEALIRRCVHPDDDIAGCGLLIAEKRWSYTVFFSSLARYLDLKAEAGELDPMYAYARASLIAYARWMLDHERAYFDRREELEYPTEAWPAQDFRKANVMRLAAEHADEPLRSSLIGRALEISERAWSDLLAFGEDRRTTARAVALMMVEGALDAFYRNRPPGTAPRPSGSDHDFGTPEPFVPQKARVRSSLATARGLAGALVGLLDVRWWRGLVRRSCPMKGSGRPGPAIDAPRTIGKGADPSLTNQVMHHDEAPRDAGLARRGW